MAASKKPSRGAAARALVAAEPVTNLLPPDPRPDARLLVEGGRTPGMLPGVKPTPGVKAWLNNENPRAIRRRCIAMLNEAMPEITQRSIEIALAKPTFTETGEVIGVDQRVAAVMINAIQDRMLGKASDAPAESGGDDQESAHRIPVQFLKPERQVRLSALFDEMAEIREEALAAERAAGAQ